MECFALHARVKKSVYRRFDTVEFSAAATVPSGWQSGAENNFFILVSVQSGRHVCAKKNDGEWLDCEENDGI